MDDKIYLCKTFHIPIKHRIEVQLRLSFVKKKSYILRKFNIGAVKRGGVLLLTMLHFVKCLVMYAADREMCYLAGQRFDKHTSVFSPRSAVHRAIHWCSSANTAFGWMSSSSVGNGGYML